MARVKNICIQIKKLNILKAAKCATEICEKITYIPFFNLQWIKPNTQGHCKPFCPALRWIFLATPVG